MFGWMLWWVVGCGAAVVALWWTPWSVEVNNSQRSQRSTFAMDKVTNISARENFLRVALALISFGGCEMREIDRLMDVQPVLDLDKKVASSQEGLRRILLLELVLNTGAYVRVFNTRQASS
jgi:hypothetical protein